MTLELPLPAKITATAAVLWYLSDQFADRRRAPLTVIVQWIGAFPGIREARKGVANRRLCLMRRRKSDFAAAHSDQHESAATLRNAIVGSVENVVAQFVAPLSQAREHKLKTSVLS